MARRRFFVPEVRRGIAEVGGDLAEHLVRVLRVETGQLYEISDNQKLYLAEITSARKSSVVFTVREELPPPIEELRTILLAALIKFDRFEWLVEKATELGVSEIVPFEATRSERGLSQAALKRMGRWKKIALEAGQQARRARLPVITQPQSFKEALRCEATVRLFLDEDSAAPAILNCLPLERGIADSVAVMLGPEGGWTEEEKAAAVAGGWKGCSLGNTVLRAETAAVAGLAVVKSWWHSKLTL